MKQATGAAKVVVFDHNVRCAPMAQRGENGAHEPVKFAHNDYTIKSGPQRVRDLVPDAADRLLRQRFALIHLWRPIRGPVEESPLAVCDAHSIAQRDFVPTDLKYRDRTGEVYSLAFNTNHRCFYLPPRALTLLRGCHTLRRQAEGDMVVRLFELRMSAEVGIREQLQTGQTCP